MEQCCCDYVQIAYSNCHINASRPSMISLCHLVAFPPLAHSKSTLEQPIPGRVKAFDPKSYFWTSPRRMICSVEARLQIEGVLDLLDWTRLRRSALRVSYLLVVRCGHLGILRISDDQSKRSLDPGLQ